MILVIIKHLKSCLKIFITKKLQQSRQKEKKKEEEEINNIRNKNGLIDYEKLMRKISFKDRNINNELVKKYFFTYDMGNVLKNVKKSKTNSERNKIQLSTIKNGLRDLKEEITNMSEEEKKSKNQMKQQILLKVFLSLIDDNKDMA